MPVRLIVTMKFPNIRPRTYKMGLPRNPAPGRGFDRHPDSYMPKYPRVNLNSWPNSGQR